MVSVGQVSYMSKASLPHDSSVDASSERTVTEAAASIMASNSLMSAHYFVSIKLTARNYLF